MKKRPLRTRLLVAGSISALLVAGLYETSKLTGFQFFGEIHDRVRTDEKIVALTFDDGPNPPYTNRIAEILERHGIRATFFMIGERMERNPETAPALLARGHELGNHSYSHLRMLFRSPSFVREEIERTDALLRQAGAKGEIHFRAPFGKKLFVLPYVLSRMKKKNILFDVIPLDPSLPSAEAIRDYVVPRTRPGSIIVLHDGGGIRAHTVAATEMIVTELAHAGYRFLTVSELLRRDSANIER